MRTKTLRRRGRRGRIQRVRKPVKLTPTEDRHVMRDADKRNEYPKRPGRGTHPFETTMDF